MRKRYGCNLAARTIKALWWCFTWRFVQFARLVSVPSRVCVLASILYYAMSAGCVAAAAQSSRTAWHNETGESSYVSETPESTGIKLRPLRNSKPVVEYSDVSANEIKEHAQSVDCAVLEGDDNRGYRTSAPVAVNGSSIIPSSNESTITSNLTLRLELLTAKHLPVFFELRTECERAERTPDDQAVWHALLTSFSSRSLPFCDTYLLAHVMTTECLRSSCESCVFTGLEQDSNASIEFDRFVHASYNFDGALWPPESPRHPTEPQLVLGDDCLVRCLLFSHRLLARLLTANCVFLPLFCVVYLLDSLRSLTSESVGVVPCAFNRMLRDCVCSFPTRH